MKIKIKIIEVSHDNLVDLFSGEIMESRQRFLSPAGMDVEREK